MPREWDAFVGLHTMPVRLGLSTKPSIVCDDDDDEGRGGREAEMRQSFLSRGALIEGLDSDRACSAGSSGGSSSLEAVAALLGPVLGAINTLHRTATVGVSSDNVPSDLDRRRARERAVCIPGAVESHRTVQVICSRRPYLSYLSLYLDAPYHVRTNIAAATYSLGMAIIRHNRTFGWHNSPIFARCIIT